MLAADLYRLLEILPSVLAWAFVEHKGQRRLALTGFTRFDLLWLMLPYARIASTVTALPAISHGTSALCIMVSV